MSGTPENLSNQFRIYKDEIEPASEEANLDIQFAQNLVKYGGKFFYCENMKDCSAQLKMLKDEKKWSYIHCWEEELKTSLGDKEFQREVLGYSMEDANAAVSTSECLVSETGGVVLAPKQAARRRLPTFPPIHIIIAETGKMFSTLDKAVEFFHGQNKDELPFLVDLSKPKDWKYSVNNIPVLYAQGPKELYVFLCDEKLH